MEITWRLETMPTKLDHAQVHYADGMHEVVGLDRCTGTGEGTYVYIPLHGGAGQRQTNTPSDRGLKWCVYALDDRITIVGHVLGNEERDLRGQDCKCRQECTMQPRLLDDPALQRRR